jgi:hypothetical protein
MSYFNREKNYLALNRIYLTKMPTNYLQTFRTYFWQGKL